MQTEVVASMVLLLFLAWLYENDVIEAALIGMKGTPISPQSSLKIMPEVVALLGEFILCALILPSPWGSIISISILAGYIVYHPQILMSIGG